MAYLSAFPHLMGRAINPYIIHQKVWEAFPGRDDQEVPFLFAIQEEDGQVYVRSNVAPQWPLEGIRVKQERTSYPDEMLLIIEVLLNPIRRSKGETLIRDRAGVQDFAIRLLEQHGMEVLLPDEEEEEEDPGLALQRLSGLPVVKEDGSEIPLNLVRCKAVVRVTDSAKFQAALEEGIGRKKAFGSGMILVRNVLS